MITPEKLQLVKEIITVLVGPASARYYKIGVVGNWLVGWLVTQFSKKSYRARFLKKILDLEIFAKRSQN